MAETQETTADVISAMRDEAARADMEQDYSINDAAEMMREFAWRFEAAHKRERGVAVTGSNQLREALRLCMGAMCKYCVADAEARGLPTECVHGCEALLKAKAALAEPVKNCEVGTAEEQAKRWYWRYHVGHLCQSCPLGPRKWSEVDAGTLCFSEWQQMPYEEGGAK